VEIPFTPRAKRVLELSLEEARTLGHNYIGTEHLLLGLLRESEYTKQSEEGLYGMHVRYTGTVYGIPYTQKAARVLENLGADPTKIRNQVSP